MIDDYLSRCEDMSFPGLELGETSVAPEGWLTHAVKDASLDKSLNNSLPADSKPSELTLWEVKP